MSTSSARSNLTHAQSLIWAGQQLHPSVPLYNMALAFRIAGPIDVAVFQRAFSALVAGTDAMRTVFTESGGVANRVVRDDIPSTLRVVDLSFEADPERVLETWAEGEATKPFDLGESLYRSALLRIGPTDYVWWLSQHHLITDGWSAAIVYERMEALYRAAAEGQLADVDSSYPTFEFYADYERRFRTSDGYATAVEYWDTKLGPATSPIALYGTPRQSTGNTRTDRITVKLGPKRGEALDLFVAAAGSPLMEGMSRFNLFATALIACLARISDEEQLTILAPAHNRPTPRFKDTAGLMIEVLPLSVAVDREDTFRSLASKVGQEAQNLLIHARPGTSSAEHSRSASVLLNFINASFGPFNGWPMRSDWVHAGHGDADHVLRLQVHDFDAAGEYRLHFDVSRDVFDTERKGAIVRHFLLMLDALLSDSEARIADVGLLSHQETEALAAFNRGGSDCPHSTVLEAFAAQVAVAGGAVAVSSEGRRLTYAELDGTADRLARLLVARVGSAPRVGICLRRSVETMVAVLGVLKAGGSYVPIDAQHPAERVAFMIADSGAQAVVADEEFAGRVPGDVPVVVLPLDPDVGDAGPSGPAEAEPGDVAYVMYTSGSTGNPKGVAVSHGSLINYTWWARGQYGGGGPVSFPLYSSIGFDLTVTSMFVPLVSGGTVVVYPEPDGSDLSIRDVFADDAVDVVKLTPSHLALVDPDLLATSRIRTLVLGGEDLKTSVARFAWEASGKRLEIINEYGPTEATVACMVHHFDPEHDLLPSVPLGRPAANAQIHLVDGDLAPVPVGVIGEIAIGGAGVAMGYLGLPEMTDECFVPDPFRSGGRLYRTGDRARWRSAGEIEFFGRSDDQVKVRGYRIELGEIENAIQSYPPVVESAVTVVQTETERLAANRADVAYCVRCGLASNHPEAHIDADGICGPCRFYDAYRESAERYWGTIEEFRSLVAVEGRPPGSQDAVMLLSGGKDSTYALYQLVELGLTPLVFSLDNGFISDGAKANINRVVDDLELELVWGTTSGMNEIFADSLDQFSNVCQGCFKTVYTLGSNLAHERGLPRVVTGLSRGQIFETRLADLFRVGITERDEVDQAVVDARRAYHGVDDAVRRVLDTSLFERDDVFDQIQIVDFYRYHDVGLSEVYAFLEKAAWVRPADTGRSTNCLINNTGIYVHKKERGYHNYALPYSWDVRLGHKTRRAALAELDDEIDVVEVRNALHEVGYEIKVGVDEGPGLRQLDHRLVGYYVTGERLATPAQVRSHLAQRLPDYMVPSYLVHLDTIPLTVNGKVDRAALPDPRGMVSSDDEHYVAPRTSQEEMLVDVWESVLGVEGIGVYDRFIEIGGDSILSIQVVARARSNGLAFSPQQLFEGQTIAAVAAVAEEVGAVAPASLGLPRVDGFGSPSFPDADLSQAELDEVLEAYGE